MKDSTLEDYTHRMLRVLVHVQEHLDEELSLDELARIACFSRYHFHRIFRGMVGESVHEHVRRLRLERAAGRLRRTSTPIIHVALEAGYESHEAFSRAFRSLFALSPSEFRARGAPAAAAGRVHYREDGLPPEFIPEKGGESMEVTIERMEPMSVAFVRHVGPYPECGAAWDRLTTWLGSQGWVGAGSRFIGVSHDDPEITPPARLRYDACVAVDETFEPVGEIGVQVLAGGEYARTTHLGAYDLLGETYAKLIGQWVPRSGRELRASPCLEEYFNDPETTDVEDLVTDIFVPLASEGARG